MNKKQLSLIVTFSLLMLGCGGSNGGNTESTEGGSNNGGSSGGDSNGSGSGGNTNGPYAGTGIKSPRLKLVKTTNGRESWTTTFTYGEVSGDRVVSLRVSGSPDDDQICNYSYAAGLLSRTVCVDTDGESSEVIHRYGSVIFLPTLNPVVSTIELKNHSTIEHTYALEEDGLHATKLTESRSSLGFVSKYKYNESGFLKEVTYTNDPSLHGKKTYHYNSLNQLTKVEQSPREIIINGVVIREMGSKKEFFYKNNLIASGREYEWERVSGNSSNYDWELVIKETFEFEDGNFYYHQPPDAISIEGLGGY